VSYCGRYEFRDELQGGGWPDVSFYSDRSKNTLYGGPGRDFLAGADEGGDVIYGGAGDDKMLWGGGARMSSTAGMATIIETGPIPAGSETRSIAVKERTNTLLTRTTMCPAVAR